MKEVKHEKIAKKFMDTILHDNDFVNRWNPFDEKVHYGDWTNKISNALDNPIEVFGDDFFNDEMIDSFSTGDYLTITEMADHLPELKPLNDILDEYVEYLENIPCYGPTIKTEKQ